MRRANAIVAIGVLLDKVAVLLCADHRPRIARQGHDGEHAKDSVDGAPLEPELAQVRARQQRPGRTNKLGGRRSMRRATCALLPVSPLARWLRDDRVEIELLLRRLARHSWTVADSSHW